MSLEEAGKFPRLTMRCPFCNTPLTLLRPQSGDMEAVCRCDHCGRIYELDAQPSVPEQAVWPVTDKPIIPSRPLWLN